MEMGTNEILLGISNALVLANGSPSQVVLHLTSVYSQPSRLLRLLVFGGLVLC